MALATARDSALPSFFNLLWDYEIENLQPLLRTILSNREVVLEHWHSLYVLHFGDRRTLSKSEFLRLYGEDLEATIGHLAKKDIPRFTADVRRVGEELAERQVPFAEVIVSMHLFEESATGVFPEGTPPQSFLVFDKLSHCRMIVLADAYFRSQAAVSAARVQSLEQEAAQLPSDKRSRFHGLVGASPPMRRLYERIEAAAATRGTVLIVGESGSGKELVARAIHECSPAAAMPFVALNCAAIPKELVESELFGYKRGAFSGATTEYLGLFRAADGGTLFLDEVTEMGADTQTKLLRALQERTVRPVGATSEVPVDVRLIASSNREPEAAVRSGQLREDLYYRLRVNQLSVPPLRERVTDIPLLVEHFIAMFNEKLGRKQPIVGIEPEALCALQQHRWPGNVRELANAIESAFTFGRSPTIRMEDLPLATARLDLHPENINSGGVPTYAEVERDLIRRALESTEGNKVQAARLLRISRKKLYAKIEKYQLASLAKLETE
ncbi:MAG TPA: sigma-54 dependent transcriptional regulator [Candidatus Binataceae bacterium]|nr:sigma-54 dependent transcriptional regulator [Candidatus Binataceae bacterium]